MHVPKVISYDLNDSPWPWLGVSHETIWAIFNLHSICRYCFVKGSSTCFMGDTWSLPWGIAKIVAYDFWTMHQYPVQWVLLANGSSLERGTILGLGRGPSYETEYGSISAPHFFQCRYTTQTSQISTPWFYSCLWVCSSMRSSWLFTWTTVTNIALV